MWALLGPPLVETVDCGPGVPVRGATHVRETPIDYRADEIVAWVSGVPGPVAVTHAAGATGFVSARALTAAGVRAVVAAPSKLQRPAVDRVETGMRDAVHMARLLRLGEVVEVAV